MIKISEKFVSLRFFIYLCAIELYKDMCLVTAMKTPFTAKKDFVVCKVLTKTLNEDFVTFCMDAPVKLNDTLKPDISTDFLKILEITEGFRSEIGEGAIHAYTYTLKGAISPIFNFKAIVRKGTRFYVNTSGTEIAAEELYITDEKPTEKEIAETQEYIAQELIDAAEQHNGIRVGDILLSDKSFVHVEDYKDDGSMTAIGVIGYFIDEKPISVALEANILQWELKDSKAINEVCSALEAYEDYNGRKYTDKLYAAYKDRLRDFPALKYCVEYKTKGTKKGDWYFPSSGEVANIGRNAVVINHSLNKIKSFKVTKNVDCLWSIGESFLGFAWSCYMHTDSLSNCTNKGIVIYVRPVFGI